MTSSAFFTSCSKPGDATVQKAMKSYSSHDYDTALQLFQQALTEDSHYSPELLYTFIGTVYSQQENLPESITYQEKAVSLHPDYRAYVTLGMTYHMAGDDLNARRNYEKAIALDPTHGEAYESLGSLYLAQNNAAQAVPLLEKAAKIEPKLAIIPANLAVAYAMLDRIEESEAAYNRAVALHCENIDKFRERINNIKEEKKEINQNK